MAGVKSDSLDPDKIRANLKTRRVGRKILVFSSTSSTNDVATEYAKDKAKDGLVIFAEEQTAGRGRAGSKWKSESGDSILCSIVLAGCKLNSELLSLACAVAVADALGNIGGSDTKIKWPNDIILKGKKVAGILLESKSNKISGTYVLGIGINCHQKRDCFPPELQPIATSIDIESQSTVDRISLAKRLLISVEYWLEIAANKNEKIIEKWCQLSIQLNHRVKLIYNGKEFSGNCIGVDPEKGLILQLDTGGVRMFEAAHTTIIKSS